MTQVRPSLELLEDRYVPATFGFPWTFPSHLTLSFLPDGTSIATHESNLHQTLNQQFNTTEWQRALLLAFQTWAVHANLNFGWQSDEGQPLGTAGLAQGDPRFGDIRIGAQEMTSEVLAISVPPDPALSGTLSGDVLLNSAYNFNSGPYSLFRVALHEAGNALGLADSDNPDSVMYRTYNSTRTELSPEDIERIQALYGVRTSDSYEGLRGNNTRARAAAFRLPTKYKGETPLVAFGSVTTANDVDFYAFSFYDDGNDDQNDRSATIRLQTDGISLMQPRLTVFDSEGRVLARRVSTSLTGDTLQVTLEGLSSRAKYYVRVDSMAGDAFAIGSYGLSVRLNNTSSTADAVIDRLLRGPFAQLGPDAIDAFFRNSGDVLLNDDLFSNETTQSATRLSSVLGFAPETRYETVASIAKVDDVDVYRIVSPSGNATVLTVSVWTTDTQGFLPQVTVLDAIGKPVPTELLANGNGASTVQASNVHPGRVYYLRVQLAPFASEDKGNYWLNAHFSEVVSPLDTFATGTLGERDRQDSHQLSVATTQLFHFVLTAGNESPDAAVRLTIRDLDGNTIYTLVALAGQSVSAGSVVIRPGQYTAVFEVENPGNQTTTYLLRGRSQSNPIGPVPGDATLAPRYTSTQNPGLYLHPGIPVPYDPRPLPGYVQPQDPNTYPQGFVLPPEYVNQLWLLVTRDPFAWIPFE